MHFTADSCWLPSLDYAPSRIERKLLCFAMIHCFNAGQKCCSGINGGVCCSWSLVWFLLWQRKRLPFALGRAVRSVRKCLPNLRPLLGRSLRRVWTDLQASCPKWQNHPRKTGFDVWRCSLFSCCRCLHEELLPANRCNHQQAVRLLCHHCWTLSCHTKNDKKSSGEIAFIAL